MAGEKSGVTLELWSMFEGYHDVYENGVVQRCHHHHHRYHKIIIRILLITNTNTTIIITVSRGRLRVL